jgi:hypothetical protein
MNECDYAHPDSINLPEVRYNELCHECEKGKYLIYNPSTKKLDCEVCPEDTYSLGGNIRINGLLREWNKQNEFFRKISTNCYLRGLDLGANCTAWTISNDNSYIYAGVSTVNQVTDYTAKMMIDATLVKKGKVRYI